MSDPGDFIQFLSDAIRSCDGSSAVSMDRHRPYDAQPWTCGGVRGACMVSGLTMRDIGDCYTRAVVHSLNPDSETGRDLRRKLDDGTLIWENLHEADLSQCDPSAIRQNLGCEIERMMGIFPNVPQNRLEGAQ